MGFLPDRPTETASTGPRRPPRRRVGDSPHDPLARSPDPGVGHRPEPSRLTPGHIDADSVLLALEVRGRARIEVDAVANGALHSSAMADVADKSQNLFSTSLVALAIERHDPDR